MDCWESLPSVILLKIMYYLNRRDRLNCGLACKYWYTTMSCPLLWKNIVICVDTDLTDPLTIATTKRYSHHITSLSLVWSKPFLPRRWIKNRMFPIGQDTCRFLILLRENNVALDSLTLSDWCFTWKFKRVVYLLTTFLKQQKHLRCLSLSHAYLYKSEVVKILFACNNSKFFVTYLDLLGSFHNSHDIFTCNNFANALRQFSNLETLKLDYSSLSDLILMTFVINGNISLKVLEINVTDVDHRSHVIAADVWSKIKNQCKNLKVALSIHNICHYEDIHYMLVDTMPLEKFSLNCGHIWDQRRSRHYCRTLDLLTNNYEETLTHVSLQLRNNRESLDNHILEMIQRCKKLEHLEFDGVLRSMEVLRDICDLQCSDEDYNFRFFHVRPRCANLYNNLVLSDIWRSYAKPLEEHNVDFEVEAFNNPAVRIYY